MEKVALRASALCFSSNQFKTLWLINFIDYYLLLTNSFKTYLLFWVTYMFQFSIYR